MSKKKVKKVLMIIFITLVIAIDVIIAAFLLLQTYFNLLTCFIVNESTKSNANYQESKYCDIIDENQYCSINMFKADSDNFEYIKSSKYHTYAYITVINSVDTVSVHYMYSIKYDVVYPDGTTTSPSISAMCTLTFQHQEGMKWKVISYDEPP